MKKKLLSLTLALLLLLSALSLWSCNDEGATPPETVTGEYSRVTVDINPSVEILSDKDGKVIAVTPLNDEAGVLLAGEDSLVGMPVEEAVGKVVSLAYETGYLIHGEVKDGENTVRLSVSGDSAYASRLYESAKKKVSGVLVSLDIDGKIERVDALKTEALRELAASDTLLTEEELAEMNDEQLYQALADSRAETAALLTEELRNAYLHAKESELALAAKEETAKILEGMSELSALSGAAYSAALQGYEKAVEALETYRYESLIAPDSVYQQALARLREKKAALLEKKAELAKMAEDGTLSEELEAALKAREEAYDAALASLTAHGESVDAALDSLAASLKTNEEILAGIEKLFPEEIKTALADKADEIGAAVAERAESFRASFEEAHAEDIAAAEAALKAYKEELIAAARKEQ